MSLTKEHLIGLTCMGTGAGVYLISRTFPKAATGANELTGPAFFPTLLALGIFLCGLAELINGFRASFNPEELNWKNAGKVLGRAETQNVLLIILLIIGYIYSMEFLGFLVATGALLLILMWRFKVPLLKNLIFTAFFLLVLYLLFGKLFTIYLPSGILEYVGL